MKILDDDNYIGWCRWIGVYKTKRLQLCDSNDTGAFKIYRHPKDQPEPITYLWLDKLVQDSKCTVSQMLESINNHFLGKE